MPQIKKIDIGKDFSQFPGGRVYADGPYCGEAFREKFLKPNLKGEFILEITIDNVVGFGSSFLEECFGGLVRNGFSESFLRDHMKLVYQKEDFSFYADEIWQYIKDVSENAE